MTRQLLLVFLAATALTPACVIRRGRLDREPEAGIDAFVVGEDTRADVGMVVPEDTGRDAVIANDVPGADAAPCGGRRDACCDGTTCESLLACRGGTCVPCGNTGETCCAGDNCPDGVCDLAVSACHPCGASGERCCVGNTCDTPAALGCSDRGLCEPCGVAGGPCCPGSSCDGTLSCNADNRCENTTSGDRCEMIGGPCCADRSCSALGSYCNLSGNCESFCGGRDEICCLGSCREGSCMGGLLDRRCRR